MRGHERFQHDGACAGLPGGGGVLGEGWLSVMKNLGVRLLRVKGE